MEIQNFYPNLILRMGQLLQFAAQGMVGQEYPCKLCDQKFITLYGVKLHILETHEDFVGRQRKESKGSLSGKKKLGMKKRGHKKLTHTKKPWCNYCWIKFKDHKEHIEHRMVCPNKPQALSPGEPLTSEKQEITLSKSPIKIETKVNEGNEITDLVDTPTTLPRPSKTTKLNMMKLKTVSDDESEGRNSPTEVSMDTEDSHFGALEDSIMKEESPDDQIRMRRPPDEENTVEAMECENEALDEKPSYTGPVVSLNSQPLDKNWRERDRQRILQCPVPIRPVSVIMPDRAERVLEINRHGTYQLTELDQLGMTISEFAADPIQELTDVKSEPASKDGLAEASSTESPILSKLLDKSVGRAHSCSLCTSSLTDLTSHVTNYHKLSIEGYLKVFPGDASKFDMEKKPTAIQLAIRVKTENELCPPKTIMVKNPDSRAHIQLAAENKSEPGRPWYESVKTTCKICGKNFWHGQFVKHVKYEHATPLKEYRELYPQEQITIGQYQCMVCHAHVAHYSSPISGHLTSKHGMTITEYYEAYERFREKNEKGEMMRKKAEEKVTQKINHPPLGSKLMDILKSSPLPKSDVKEDCVVIKSEPDVMSIVNSGLTVEGPSAPPLERGAEAEVGLKEALHPLMEDSEKKFRCKICSQLVSLTKDSITEHMESVHGSLAGQDQSPTPIVTQPESNSEPSSPWYNKCSWTCLLCSKTFCSGFWKHVNEKHFLKKEDYIRDYGKQGIHIVHYFCRICDKKVPWSGASINAHTKATHCLSLQEYESIYEPSPAQRTDVTPQSDVLAQAKTKPQEDVKPPVQMMPTILTPQGLVTTLVPLASALPMVQAPTMVSATQQSQNLQTEKWYNGCEYTCQICYLTLHSVAGLSLHLNDVHGMEKLDYFKQFGRDGIKVRKYCCKICGNCFPWSGVSISKHLIQNHQMNLQEYSRKYEPGRTFQHGGALAQGLSKSLAVATQQIRYVLKHSTMDRLATGEGFQSITKQSITSEKKGEKWYNKCSWNCQLCGRHFKTNASAMFKHVTQDHKVSVEEYKKRYSNTGTTFVDHKCRLCFKKIPCNGLAMCKHFKHSHGLTLEEYEQLYMLDDDGSSDGQSYIPTQDHWYNKCVWKCQICGKDNKSQGSSKKHVAQMHKITYEEYFELFGNQGITEIPWTCTICDMVVSCNGVSIASHLNGNHKMTLQEYEAAHLKEADQSPSQTPTLKSKASSTVQSFHIGIDDQNDESVVSFDEMNISTDDDPLTHGNTAQAASFDPLADIEIENVVSIEEPDFTESSLMESDSEAVEAEAEFQLGGQGAVLIHNMALLEEDSKTNILKLQ